jgi:hypothetical protein
VVTNEEGHDEEQQPQPIILMDVDIVHNQEENIPAPPHMKFNEDMSDEDNDDDDTDDFHSVSDD